ncbi:hypothetical protein BAUCODRAFT_121902 [Baudoinia panamericana UAMH 10762]|uniref:Uncharacterized protein n=1 Tax=Baudoinia panamericana (strain UAMH 10762) TaxID=717646 RepID=M2N0K5_BAUPA|nr:uncharacterized protein BAUCODRAFT_121902 [Baudoinia panamericana UAMH 10762]EMC97453.1 hypothetical protein BAUCODRAFT_121902 [Baudoinia panamericana UAMH 10762]
MSGDSSCSALMHYHRSTIRTSSLWSKPANVVRGETFIECLSAGRSCYGEIAYTPLHTASPHAEWPAKSLPSHMNCCFDTSLLSSASRCHILARAIPNKEVALQ